MATRLRLWAVEYSHEQGCLHVQPLLEAVRANQRFFINQPETIPDYIPIFVGSKRQCERVAKLAQASLDYSWKDEQTWTH